MLAFLFDLTRRSCLRPFLCSPCGSCRGSLVTSFTSHPVLQDTIFVAPSCTNHVGFYGHYNDNPAQKLGHIQIQMLESFKKLEFLQKNTCQLLASGFDIFSSLSVCMTWYCLSGDTYRFGEYCNGFLQLNGSYKWLHLCNDGTAVSKATTAEGILAPQRMS